MSILYNYTHSGPSCGNLYIFFPLPQSNEYMATLFQAQQRKLV